MNKFILILGYIFYFEKLSLLTDSSWIFRIFVFVDSGKCFAPFYIFKLYNMNSNWINNNFKNFQKWSLFDQISRTWARPHFSFFQSIFNYILWIQSLMMQMNFQNDFRHRLLSHLKSGDQYSNSFSSKHADPQKTQMSIGR